MASGDQQQLRELVDEVVRRAGYDLEDVTVVSAGRRRQVRVVIDREGGVDLDDAAAVSRDLSERLDGLAAARESDPMGAAPYTLEVTSPGVGRPLTLPRHFRRSAGRLLAVTLTSGQSTTGRVRRTDEHRVELLTGARGTESTWLDLTDIDHARVEVEFSRPSAEVLALLGSAAPAQMSAEDDPGEDGADDADDLESPEDLETHDIHADAYGGDLQVLRDVDASTRTREREDRPS